MNNHPNWAEIHWKEDGTPCSTLFDDIFFSRGQGIAEGDYVFLKGNNLHKRWPPERDFTIGEAGFGVGLNFLLAWRLWEKLSINLPFQLNFVSFEKFPPKPDDILKCHQQMPELRNLSTLLINSLPDLTEGTHHISFKQKKTSLTLIIGDIRKTIDKRKEKVDAWFLDGFCPKKNPEMWEHSLLNTIFKLTRNSGTFATYTSAGPVRRGLCHAGFRVKKIPGFGLKREMLIGEKVEQNPQKKDPPLTYNI